MAFLCVQDSAYGTDGRKVRFTSATQLRPVMFFFFSNKLGCLGSVLVSAALTLIVLALLGIINVGSPRIW